MNNTNLENIILQTINIVTSKKISEAGYDKTVQGIVLSCVDANIGKYKIQYQDSYWFAYSNNVNITYSPGSSVYVLVPNGDMSKDKTILGATDKLGVDYSLAIPDEEKYILQGENLIDYENEIGLCSYKTETKILYNVNLQQNMINIDINKMTQYLKQSNSLAINFYVKNNLNVEQRYQGNYGILVSLDYTDINTDDIITKYYTIDIDKMSGNPYYYPNEVKQYGFFEIDSENFLRINTVALFTKDFLNQDNTKPDDIFISKIQIGGANMMSQEQLNGYSLTILTPKGYIFTSENLDTDTRTLQAQLRAKGKIVDLKGQNVSVYWFVQNMMITSASKKYNRYGGQGWECLNSYNVIRQETQDSGGNIVEPEIIQFVTAEPIYSIAKSDILAQKVKYKCVVVYNNTSSSKEITIIRQDAQYQIYIQSNGGTQFYDNIGKPTLTCYCKYKQDHTDVNIENLKFVWSSINNIGAFQSLSSNEDADSNKNKLILIEQCIKNYLDVEYLLYEQIFNQNRLFPTDIQLQDISDQNRKTRIVEIRENLQQNNITAEIIRNLFYQNNVQTGDNITYNLLLNGDVDHVRTINKAIKNYDNIQVVSKNKIFNLYVKNITNFTTYKCSVFTKQSNQFLGTADITITNSLDGNNLYNLVINNGIQVFKYNTEGISPISKKNEISLQIPTLTFTIYDNLGNRIEDDIIQRKADITWVVPSHDTLLEIDSSYTGTPDSNFDNMLYKNHLMSFNYKIAQNYNPTKTRNNINLIVKYNDTNLIASTNLTFLKQGDEGTNGTDIVCKIIPNTSGTIPYYPIIYYNENRQISFNWNMSYGETEWFLVELWNNGTEPIFRSAESGTADDGKTVTIVKWQVLKNIYSSTQSDQTNFIISQNISNNKWNFGLIDTNDPNSVFNSSYDETLYKTWRPANIIKVTVRYDDHTYYATLPIIISKLFDSNNYRVRLKDYTGFRRVLYNSSGLRPQYDNHSPFEIITEQKIGTKWQDISLKISQDYKVGYQWFYMGSIWYRDNNRVWQQNYEQTISKTSLGESSKKWLLKSNLYEFLQDNQKAIKPIDSYDGECVNTGLACRVYLNKDGKTLGWIHIPIHMSFNRFENAAINEWDGNSVNLGGDNGGMILAPQIGAGTKDSNNKFTGVFFGTSKDSTYGQNVGLFGYNQGVRTIFLDAETGKAEFGKNGAGQIRIDPSQNEAIIESGNYVEKTNLVEGSGMRINLTQPSIEFGSEKFSVDSNGVLRAVDAIISGDAEISGTIKVGGSQNSSILLYENSVGSNIAGGWDVNNFWLGGTSAQNANFKVTSEGTLILKSNQSSIDLGESKYISSETGQSYIFPRVHIDKNGIKISPFSNGKYNFEAIGGNVSISRSITLGYELQDGSYPLKIDDQGRGSINLGNGQFKVTDAGVLTMKNGSIQLGSTYYSSTDNSVPQVVINENQIKIGPIYNTTTSTWNYNFVVTDAGVATIKKNLTLGEPKTIKVNNVNITKYPLTIDAQGKLDLYMEKGQMHLGNFEVDSDGNLTAINANISGNIDIGKDGGGLTIWDGSKQVGSWSASGLTMDALQISPYGSLRATGATLYDLSVGYSQVNPYLMFQDGTIICKNNYYGSAPISVIIPYGRNSGAGITISAMGGELHLAGSNLYWNNVPIY